MRSRPAIKPLARFGQKGSWALLALLLVAGPQMLCATTRTVTKPDDTHDGACDGDCSLREAIAASAAGDTIKFAPGLSGGTIYTSSEVVVGRDLTIVGPGGGVRIKGNAAAYLNFRILHVAAGSVSLSNCTVEGGYVQAGRGADANASGQAGAGDNGLGGGILNSGNLTLTNCRVTGNIVYGGYGGEGYSGTTTHSEGGIGGDARGGGIYNEGKLALVDSTVDANYVQGGGAGRTYAVNGYYISYPGGLGEGAGIHNASGATLTMLRCTVSDNRSFGGNGGGGQKTAGGSGGGYGLGGGLYDEGKSTMANCTLSGNLAKGGPGGMHGSQSSRGAADDGKGGLARGGAITGHDVTLTNCTVSDNTADARGADGSAPEGTADASGGGVVSYQTTIHNTIVAGNTVQGYTVGAPDVNSEVTSQGHNLIGRVDGSNGWVASDLTGTEASPLDAQFVPLADNGGPTQTRALKVGSAAIDAGDDAVLGAPNNLTTDQRGLPRQSMAHVDIGAYELQAPTTFVVTNTNDTGAGSLRQAITAANDDPNADGLPDVIIFNIPRSDPGYDANTQVYTISLTSGELPIKNPVSIDGGKAHIAVGRPSGAAPFRLFSVTASGVTLANLFLYNGAAVGGGPGAPGFGGAVLNGGSLTLLNCTLAENSATGGTGTPQVFQGLPGGGAFGGAVFSEGTLVMTNCTLAYNYVQGGAGGIGYSSSGIAGRGGNGGNGDGGALFSDQGSVTVTNCTFRENSAHGGTAGAGEGGYGATGFGYGGALYSSSDVAVRNSILSGDTADVGPEYSGTVSSKSNISGNDLNLYHDYIYNGGSTPTIPLLEGSPAIDAGDDTLAPPTDQRGYPRVGGSDIGAFEFGAAAPTPTPTATPTASTLGNISTRLSVQSGDNVLIGGFIVTGTQPKKVVLRAIGPSTGIPGALANPKLELYSGETLLDSNDNWVDSPNKQAIIDTTIPPPSDLESAIVITLPANSSAYTAIVSGADGGTGVGLVEVYDLDRSVDSKLANISTRGFVQTGDDAMIGGFIVQGANPQRLIVRAIGPFLGIENALGNPTLELRDQDGGLVEANDNWVDSLNRQAIIDSTVAPTNDFESAIVATLPGNGASYTAIVRGVNDATGIASVEVYALQ